MARGLKFGALAILVSLVVPCVPSMASSPGATNEAGAISYIYSAFLRAWNGKGHPSLNVAKNAAAPTSDDLQQFPDCMQQVGLKNIHWGKATPISDLTKSIGSLPFVHLVDPKQWHAADPGMLIAQGASVNSAVSSGFAHGLMTLSAITFNTAHTVAIFNYSFVCGGTCGSTSLVVFEKTPSGWVAAKQSCFLGMY